MVDGHATDPPNELEVIQVVFIVGPRLRIDLEGVVIAGRILKETIVGVEHLMGKQVEPLSAEKGKRREEQHYFMTKT